ncbi:MAG: hypothetical protein H0V89_09880, partial [Deltaproteobacteria bacterium]|nr:hypothetical protein [Deltaproteobacteria bacterium]
MFGLGVMGLLASGASAVEFSTAAEVWTQSLDGAGGGDGNDSAWGLGVDGDGNIVAGGTLDGEPNQGTTGVVVSWDAAGDERYDLRFEAGLVGSTDSLDRVHDLTIDNLDQVTAVGRQPGSGVADGVLWAQAIGIDGTLLWERTFIDGVSPEQAAFGVAFHPANSDPFVVGWTRGDLPQLSGRWVMMRLAQASGADAAAFAPVYYDVGHESFNPDQAQDGAIDLFGNFVAAGRIGVDGGSMASDTNDSQWAVARFGSDRLLDWEDVRGGALDDEASGLVFAADGSVVVAGYENVGTDNAGGRDDDWSVVSYEAAGDGAGQPVIRWTYAYESAPGASERATAIGTNVAGNVLVVGTTVDGGVLAWRAVELSAVDGSERSEKIWPAQATDSIPQAVAEGDEILVVAGSWGNADDSDFHVTYLAPDSDSDGTIDSLDGCPDDEDKLEPGICDCNVSDLDGDGDEFADCQEICDGDPDKQDPGVCGCGFPDDDGDQDGVMSCQDACEDSPPGVEVNSLGCAPGELELVDTGGGEVAPAEPPKGGCD